MAPTGFRERNLKACQMQYFLEKLSTVVEKKDNYSSCSSGIELN